MIYTIERASLIAQQLRKFTDSYAYMVAGQFANIDFWIEETISSLKAIDEHNLRFEKMREAQRQWIEDKNVRVPDYCYICNGICELSEQHYKKPELPSIRASTEKKEARKELIDSVYFFLVRCFKIGLVNKEQLEAYCHQIGTSIDPYDLKKQRFQSEYEKTLIKWKISLFNTSSHPVYGNIRDCPFSVRFHQLPPSTNISLCRHNFYPFAFIANKPLPSLRTTLLRAVRLLSMNTHTNKAPQNLGRAVAQEVAQTKSTEGAALQFTDNRPEAMEQRAFQQSLNQSTATAQLTKLGEDERPSDGPDAEAAEIEWYRGNPYILDDKGAWRRVAREVVNNQRGERDSNHKITVAHLRTGVRKVYQKEATRIFKIDSASNFLQVVFKYGMAITAYYMSDSEAKREILGRRGTETQWSTHKEGMPVV